MQAPFRRLAALAVAAAAAASTTAIPAASGAARPGGAEALRGEQTALQSRSASALLELYALETQLAGAQAAAAAAAERVAALEAEQAAVARNLALARRNAEAAELLLGERLRALYETGDVHPLAILLGAATLDDALTGLDGLRFAAEQDRQIVLRTRGARRTLAVAQRHLGERKLAAEEAARAASARAETLARAHADRLAYVGRLTRELRLKSAQVATLERQARQARARSETLSQPVATTISAPSAPAPAVTAPATNAPEVEPAAAEEEQAETGRTITVTATGYALRGRTATGIPAGPGVVAVDPSLIPLGTRMTIPGYGEGVAADVGSAIRGAKVDVWFPTRAQALAWGRRTVTITIR